ncbi:hypothetical protein KB553_09895 [Chryseobacterium rhizoplanae]|uniref:hypothetical protein n=1 Tax=Chryseobacterium rhizoplanae TaxID=1609531 RepID=UPI001CE241DB|nr:hypothetical protein [Chryseobacterium rhizoplanae]UCA61816.1 hypothetical protein KB553_09895 [Chryseobacterium rhizoplanae]
MKKKTPFILALLIHLLVGCEQPGKSKLFKAEKNTHSDYIIKNVYLDDQFTEDEMEVIINTANNTVTIHLDGETYELKKNNDMPDYTAENAEYRYTDINGEITFLKRDLDMVIFYHKQEPKHQKNLRTGSY